MFAYAYLKNDPRNRAAMLSQNWHDLFIDEDCPFAVKQELLELEGLGARLSDPVLYFHSVVLTNRFSTATEIRRSKRGRVYAEKPKEPNKAFWVATPWLNYLYSYVQKNQDRTMVVHKLIYELSPYELGFDVTYEDVQNICNTYSVGNNDDMEAYMLTAFNERFRTDGLKYRLITGPVKESIRVLFEYMDMNFVRTCDYNGINTLYDLRRDIDPPEVLGRKYTSINDLERNHDARTNAAVQEQIRKAKNGKGLEYNALFYKIIKDNGFKLPSERADMIERGARHHNCVASYADRHITIPSLNSKGFGECTRLIFSGDATAELRIQIAHNRIASVSVPQYKGRNNVDIEQPEGLTEVRIALAGKPADILNLREVKQDDGTASEA